MLLYCVGNDGLLIFLGASSAILSGNLTSGAITQNRTQLNVYKLASNKMVLYTYITGTAAYLPNGSDQ